MSSDQNTPDFDSMSPEEMMAWMESLAKRQGASEGFTTAADMEVDEIDPDTVDMASLGEYIPHGWSEDKWKAHLAKEEADKAAKQVQAPSTPPPAPKVVATPPPAPEPEPIAQAVASSDGTPDFDSMSPEEMMEWMESLAKRQGASEGFTTQAEMTIAEVDPTTVDESILKEKYVPHGWTEEKWDAHLAKEAADKATKQVQPKAAPEPEPEEIEIPELQYEPIEDEEIEFDFDDIPELSLDEEDEDESVYAGSGANPMSWLEGLAANDEDSDSIEIPDLSDFSMDMSGLDAVAAQDDDSDPMDWLAGLASDTNTGIDLNNLGADLSGLESFAIGEDEDEEEAAISSIGDADPVAWLETLADRQGAPDEELSTDANLDIPDFDAITIDSPGYNEFSFEDPMDDTQPSEELVLSALNEIDPNQLDNPEAWLDALAANSSTGDTGPLSLFDDDDEYDDEEESVFEEDHDSKVLEALNRGANVAPEDIEKFFLNQFNRAEQFADLDEDDEYEMPDNEGDSEAIAPELPDWLVEQMGGPPSTLDVSAQAVEDEDDLMADVLAGLDDEDEEDEELEIEMTVPDWLADSQPITPEDVDVPEWDGGASFEEEAVQTGIPSWLLEDADQDTGDVIADIIAGEELDIAPGETTLITTESGKVEVDPNDTWTQAFLMEDREDDAEQWYQSRVAEVSSDIAEEDSDEEFIDDIVTSPLAHAATGALEEADFPVEEDLQEGELEAVPAWLAGDGTYIEAAVPSVLTQVAGSDDSIDIPDWLQDSIADEGEIAIPDWLNEDSGVSESDDDIPDWLREAGVDDIEPAEVPSWLIETVEEPIEAVVKPAASRPVTTPQVVRQNVSPVPVSAAMDVSAALNDARGKVKGNDFDGAMVEYESVIRANSQLDAVIGDLQKLSNDNAYKKNPGVYRVLGDALMRRGDLQDALDTYRRALNLL